jgi:hypothetical protein
MARRFIVGTIIMATMRSVEIVHTPIRDLMPIEVWPTLACWIYWNDTNGIDDKKWYVIIQQVLIFSSY